MSYYALYLIPFLLLVGTHVWRRSARARNARATWNESVTSGLVDPPSLHPIVDPTRCFGSGACAAACPEQALGVVDGKAFLVNPTACIGHGACAAACPASAIRLVFGTARRGVDIPQVTPEFETNVPGIYIAGELGGMGLIRKAVEQGRQAVENIRRNRGTPIADEFDLIIAGAGPAGIAASLTAQALGMKYLTVEQEASIGGTTSHYPRGKIVMTAPMELPIIGKVNVREVSKRALMAVWQDVLERAQPCIRFGERIDDVTRDKNGFSVRTSAGTYRTRSVLLAIGRRGTPRTLDVPGEELPKVVYRLIEPEQYAGGTVLVVGGGDSALEAALDLCALPDTNVTLCYRGAAFGRVKVGNRQRLEQAEQEGRLRVLLDSVVKEITQEGVVIERNGEVTASSNDAIIVCVGGELPSRFLKGIGVIVETRHGE
ncbi:MAG: NAD(P)-binding domain-containing protein [Burkholderiaceae bacterium]|nr:NAD(P)-binding domain-containing protein [Burkholderiaceae bacterium]